MKRRPPTADEKVAALLLMYWDAKGDPIPFEIAKQMTAAQICSLVHWDHAVFHSWGGGEGPTNLTPRLIGDHRQKTANVDLPVIAKVRRSLRRRMGSARAKTKIRSRGFASKEERARLILKYGRKKR